MLSPKPAVPDYTAEDIVTMLGSCKDDPEMMKFVSSLLVAAGFWYHRSRLMMLLNPLFYIGGLFTGYYIAGGWE